jgi:glucosyl-dolichyl phosphate glucuronosyltransferase
VVTGTPTEAGPATAAAPSRRTGLTTSVVICAFTPERWADLRSAVESVRAQTLAAGEILVVVDHNEALLRRASAELSTELTAEPTIELTGVRVVASAGPPGLSGARNTGVQESTGDVVLFLDDDAVAEADWVARTVHAFRDPDVIGVAGWALPRWDPPGRPGWFPEPLLWVVGCSYQGLPTSTAPVRNPIGAVMAFRRRAFELAGGFTTGIGRVGSRPMGCEETEFSIRVRQAEPTARIVLEPTARATHRVTAERMRPRYLVRRCWYEGRSKRLVSELVGSGDGLASERGHLLRVLPGAVLGGLASTARSGRPAGVLSALAVVVGAGATVAGYLAEWVIGRAGRS